MNDITLFRLRYWLMCRIVQKFAAFWCAAGHTQLDEDCIYCQHGLGPGLRRVVRLLVPECAEEILRS